MSELPPNIDAILASIRSRMTEEGSASPPPPPPPEPEPEVAAMPPAPDLGQVEVGGQATTLEALVKSMLEPMLQAWLDANMPEIVERLAQAEIKRLTGRD